MQLPNNKLARFFLLFGSELVSFFVIAASFRALAKGLYIWTAATDALLILQSNLMFKVSVEDEKAREWLSIIAFTIGGACGSLLSIYVTKKLFGG